jgi:hypothetical protein
VSHASQDRAWWAAFAGIPLLFAAIAELQAQIDPLTRTPAREQEEIVLRSASTIKKMSLGYDSLLADIYWARVVQYYGSRMGTDNPKFDLLWPLLDITTTLDPKLIIGYRFGAIFLSEKGSGGAGRADLAAELVKRGIAANPREWRLYGDLGFIYYWWLRDYTHSSEAYLQGSKIPGALPWTQMMAGRMAEKGGSFDTSVLIWSELFWSTKDPSIRALARKMVAGLKAQQDLMILDDMAAEYDQRFGHAPVSMRELRDAGMLKQLPVDRDGFPFEFGPDGKARLDPKSTVVIPPAPPERPGQSQPEN